MNDPAAILLKAAELVGKLKVRREPTGPVYVRRALMDACVACGDAEFKNLGAAALRLMEYLRLDPLKGGLVTYVPKDDVMIFDLRAAARAGNNT